jgi:hypothetical protein
MSGPTGPQGLQGLRGLQGDPAPASQTGPAYGVTTARITVVTPSSSPIYLTPQNLGTYFNITSNAMAVDQLTVSFPFYNPTYGTNVSSLSNISNIPGTFGAYQIEFTTTAAHNLRVNSLVSTTNVQYLGGDLAYLNITNTTVDSVTSSTKFRVKSPPGNVSAGGTSTFDITGTVTETTAVESTNEAYPTPEQVGSFWSLKNNCKFTVYVTFSNGTVKYQGTTGVTSLGLESGNAASLMYTAANDFTVL